MSTAPIYDVNWKEKVELDQAARFLNMPNQADHEKASTALKRMGRISEAHSKFAARYNQLFADRWPKLAVGSQYLVNNIPFMLVKVTQKDLHFETLPAYSHLLAIIEMNRVQQEFPVAMIAGYPMRVKKVRFKKNQVVLRPLHSAHRKYLCQHVLPEPEEGEEADRLSRAYKTIDMQA